MKTIEVTDEQYEVLKELCHERKTQDNRCTADPIWVVQTKKHRIINPEFSCTGETATAFYGDEGDIFHAEEFDEFKSEIHDYIFVEHECEDYTDEEIESFNECSDFWDLEYWFDKFKKEHDFEEHCWVDIEYYYEDVAYFLTDKEAKDYCKYQSHNMNEPRSYVKYCGYANQGYLPKLLDMLKTLEVE